MRLKRNVSGTILQREAWSVAVDLLRRHQVPASVYAFDRHGLRMLIDGHEILIGLPAGETFYGMGNELAEIERAIAAFKASKARRRSNPDQLTIEDAITAASDEAVTA